MKKIIFIISFLLLSLSIFSLNKKEDSSKDLNTLINLSNQEPNLKNENKQKILNHLENTRKKHLLKTRITIIKVKKDLKENNIEQINLYKKELSEGTFCKDLYSAYKIDNLIFNKEESLSKKEDIQNLYIECSILEEELKKTNIKENKAITSKDSRDIEIREISLEPEKRNIILYKQNKNENTCVIDNLSVALEYETWIKLNKSEIYKKMNKNIWEFWNGWLYGIGEYWGFLQEISEWDVIEFEGENYSTKSQTGKLLLKENANIKRISEARDYTKFQEVSWYSLGKTPNIEYAILMLKSKKALVMEIPMKVLYKNSWYEKTNLFHAITIYSFDDKTKDFTFLNTLSWKLEKINLKEIEWEENKSYSKYLFFFFTNI